jgi:hypothetical protein
MIKAIIAGIEATIHNMEWRSDNKDLERLLNSMRPVYGPAGDDSYPDMTAAKDAIGRLGGRIVLADPAARSDDLIH